tara:strand:+ start:1459 stop:2406 length:948 start_codon:yes stop_codon:yes gene_type:complete
MNLPPLYLVSSDFSHDITPITCYLYNKYLPGLNINILSYTKPDFELPSNVNFIELNNGNKRVESNWFMDNYDYLNSIDDEYIMLTVDDNPLIDYVNIDALNYVLDFIKNNKDVGIFYGFDFDVKSNYKSFVQENELYKIWEVNNFPHKTNIQLNIWKRKLLLEIFKSKKNSIGHFELNGWHDILKTYKNYKVYGMTIKQFITTNQPPCNQNYKVSVLPSTKYTLQKAMYPDIIRSLLIKNIDIKNMIDKNIINETLKKKLVYGFKSQYKIPYDYFKGEFDLYKLEEFLKNNNWSEDSNMYGYDKYLTYDFHTLKD